MFLPQINRAIEEFVSDWNNHPLSSAGNRSPLSIWYSGVTSSINLRYSAMESIIQGHDWSAYGIDDDGPVPPTMLLYLPLMYLLQMKNKNTSQEQYLHLQMMAIMAAIYI